MNRIVRFGKRHINDDYACHTIHVNYPNLAAVAEMTAWCQMNCLEDEWDMRGEGGKAVFSFTNSEIALLFKLQWGN